jgi:protein-tyrosine-phosphatase
MKRALLFVCPENAGRSQMAEAIAREYGVEAASAGIKPSKEVNPIVVEAMKERGFSLANSKPKTLTKEMIDQADVIVTMGCSLESVSPRLMPDQIQSKLVDWHIDDPNGKSLEEVRKIESAIETKVLELTKKN